MSESISLSKRGTGKQDVGRGAPIDAGLAGLAQVTVVVEVETPLHDPLLDEQGRWRTLHQPHVRVIPVMQVGY